jgi:ribosomal protein S12 methylthiotransferase accessory factor
VHITIGFPGGKRVDAELEEHSIPTDQPAQGGGDNSAPSPFDLFLASIGTCSGIYVLSFCQRRGIPTEDITISQRMTRDPDTKMLSSIELDIRLPDDFPEKYRKAVVKAAGRCAVKRHLESPPRVTISTSKPGEQA